MSQISMHLLGTPQFEANGQPILLTAGKAIALLAYLATSDGPQPRERIIGLLWAESSEEAARKNLRNTLWAIRKALGDEVIRADADRLALHATVWIDTREFERRAPAALLGHAMHDERTSTYHAALALYRGPLLDGLAVPETPEFEIWLTTERERLHQRLMQLLQELVDIERAAQRWPELIDVARRAVREDNLHEPMYRALMEGHARLGERAEALRQYDLLRIVLDQELGVAPLPETEVVRTAILDGNLHASDPAPSVPARKPGRLPMLGDLHTFIGRDAERAALDATLAKSLGGQARLVLLGGEIGIGKSRLVEEWSHRLANDIRVLPTRCISATQQFPYMPLIELFGDPDCTQVLFRPGSPVAPVWLAEMARLLPEIRTSIPDLPLPAQLPPEEERRRLFEAFTQCLRALPQRGLVLAVDDLQWADQATVDWLAYLLRRQHDQPLLVVATFRPEDATPDLRQQVAAWGREGVSQRVELQRLNEAEVAALVATLGGAAHQRAALQGGGNPYYMIELSRAPSGDIPPVLADLVLARIARLPQQARQVLQAAVVLDPEWSYTLLRQTGGRSDEETLDALDLLIHAALLIEQAGRYRFAHPLISTVLRADLSQARQAFLHHRAALALEATVGTRLQQVAGQLADHYRQAGDRPQAAQYAVMAAEHALLLAAPAAAVAFYRQALEQEATPERQLGLGRALERHGDLANARVALETAQQQFDAHGDQLMAARVCLDLAYTYLSSEQSDDAARWVALAQRYPAALNDPFIRAYNFFVGSVGRQQSGQDLATAEAELSAEVALATEHKLWQLAAFNRFQLGNLLAERGDLAAALESFRAAIGLAQAAGDPFQEVLSYNNAAYHALLLGDYAAARSLLDEGMARNEAAALRVPLQWLYSTRGELAMVEQRWDEAENWFQRGQIEAEQQHNLSQIANYRANLGLVARGRGDYAAARRLLEEASASITQLSVPYLQTQLDLWLADLQLDLGERAAATQRLADAEARMADGEHKQLLSKAAQVRARLRE